MKTLTEIAELYGVTRQYIDRIARDRGIDPARTVGRTRVWTEADVKRLKPKGK